MKEDEFKKQDKSHGVLCALSMLMLCNIVTAVFYFIYWQNNPDVTDGENTFYCWAHPKTGFPDKKTPNYIITKNG